MAAPRFRLRTGAPDWAKITAVDVDDVLETGSAGDVLSDLLAVEYLLHVQEALGDEVVAKESALRELAEDARARASPTRRKALARQVGEFRDVALGIASAARAAGVDTAKWLRSLQDDGGAYEDDSEVMGSYGAARAWACAQCGKAFAVAPAPEASRRELLDFLQRGGHLEAIFGAARSEAERAVAEGTVAALLGGSVGRARRPADLGDFVAELRRCRSVALGLCASPAATSAGGAGARRAARRGRRGGPRRVACAPGLPAIAEAGCVVALSRAGQRVAETPPAVGSREPTWLTSSHGATVAVPLAADEQRRERGLFVEVFAGACLVGVAHVHARSLLYDGLLRVKLRPDDDEFPGRRRIWGSWSCGAAAARAPRERRGLRARRGAAGRAVPRGALARRRRVRAVRRLAVRGASASRRPDSFDLVAEHPLPLGLPFARRHAVLDVFALFVDDDGTEASCGDAVAVDAAGSSSVRAGEPVEFAAGSATRGLRAVASCSPLAAELGEVLEARYREAAAPRRTSGPRRSSRSSPDVAAPPDRSDLARCRVADAQLSGFELDGALLEGDALEVEAELDGVVVRSAALARAGDSFSGAGNLRLELPVEADGARRLALRVYDGAGGCVLAGALPVAEALRGADRRAAPRSLALALAPPPPDEAALVAAPPLAATLKFAVRLARVRVRVCGGVARAPSYAVSVSVGGNALGSTAPAFPVSSPAGGGRASVAWYDRFDLAVPWGADGEGGAVSLELVRVAGDGTRTSVGAAALAGSAAALAAAPGVGEATLGDARRVPSP
ncbi:hypothetical protein JL720_16902 [Aureococcus anophagefferens]|nr:hypothetical protein JL720_16902 [Aureococcus anophagefferens]